MVTKLIRMSPRAQEKSGHHNVPRRNQESFAVPVSVSHVNKRERQRDTPDFSGGHL